MLAGQNFDPGGNRPWKNASSQNFSDSRPQLTAKRPFLVEKGSIKALFWDLRLPDTVTAATFFLLHHKTKGMARIWRCERVAAISLSARRRSKKWLKFVFSYIGEVINRPQNDLFRNSRCQFFKCNRTPRLLLQFDGKNRLLQLLCLADGVLKKEL